MRTLQVICGVIQMTSGACKPEDDPVVPRSNNDSHKDSMLDFAARTKRMQWGR